MTAIYTFNYDTSYNPSIPSVDLEIGPALGEMAMELKAVVDSGADASLVPIHYLQQLGARRSRKAWMRGTTGERVLVDLYAVAIRIGPYQQGLLDVVGTTIDDEVIIGRDVLNHLTVTLNGPASVVELLA
ncbi:protein of unknown function [Candidatus Promineifilum breve]|uniref:Peptidase A2 domain-containing protein n=1 Tax=Candidatus Promineifilum breve TaxID=1806508 RepID=A0A160T430_9CHLR|nr:hypothetical protein [Candidatus Promineifilum breve]CUS04532.2 protein of unknown function [Candidatus Promineifilum breve]